MNQVEKAKEALDSLITKSRIQYYKPIQIAEILYHNRIFNDLDILDLESYRIKSKIWRNNISELLVGRVSTSSTRYQDDLFNKNAIPPEILNIFDQENKRTKGAVEAYIYKKFREKQETLVEVYEYCSSSNRKTFNLSTLLEIFRKEQGLRRSSDKIYEIIVYSLFESLIEAIELKVEVSIPEKNYEILKDFEEFSNKVMNLDPNNSVSTNSAHLFRVGTTNAADRGIDIYSNWGPTIQVKHLSLNATHVEKIIETIPGDKIVIVCKEIDKNIIETLMNQIGWSQRIQSIITEEELVNWYTKAFHGKFKNIISRRILEHLRLELKLEFPSLNSALQNPLSHREYEKIHDEFWI